MNAFTIKDLEILSGIKAHTIRIWEQRYSFLKPQRTDTNIRYYTNDELKTVLNISLLNRYGYKISHIDRMSTGEMRERILLLSQSQAQQERIINDLIHYMVDLRVDDFETTLDRFIIDMGIEKTITIIVFSFLEKIGMLWQTNHINPAQEHLVTNIIRQKLIVAIDNISGLIAPKKTALLFLPEGEYHEIGILFLQYIFKINGIKVLYLGANVPLKDVVFVVNIKKPDFVYVHLTAVANNFNLEKFIVNASNKLIDTTILISGTLVQSHKKKVNANVQLKKSLEEVYAYIRSL